MKPKLLESREKKIELRKINTVETSENFVELRKT